jgi:hypothetical protein
MTTKAFLIRLSFVLTALDRAAGNDQDEISTMRGARGVAFDFGAVKMAQRLHLDVCCRALQTRTEQGSRQSWPASLRKICKGRTCARRIAKQKKSSNRSKRPVLPLPSLRLPPCAGTPKHRANRLGATASGTARRWNRSPPWLGRRWPMLSATQPCRARRWCKHCPILRCLRGSEAARPGKVFHPDREDSDCPLSPPHAEGLSFFFARCTPCLTLKR